MLKKEKIIILLIRYSPIFFILSISLFLTYLLSVNYAKNLKTDKVYITNQYVEDNKSVIKANIHTLAHYIREETINLKEEDKNKTKEILLDYISTLKNKYNGYIFVLSFDGNALVYKNKKLKESEIFKPTKLSTFDLTTFDKFIKSKELGMFVEYKMKIADENGLLKIAYMKKIDNLNIVIGTGFYSEEANVFIEKRLKDLERKYEENLKTTFISTLILTFVLLLLSYLLSKYFEKLFKEYAKSINTKNVLLANSQKQAKIGSWEQTIDNDVLNWTEEAYDIFEFDNDMDISFEKFIDRVHPDDREKMFSTFQESVKNHIEYYSEHRLLFPDSRIKYLIVSANHFYDENDNCVSTLGTVQDITKRKQTEMELEASENQYRSLMEQAPYPTEIFDENGLQISVNKAHGNFWGFDTSKSLNKFNILKDEKFKKTGLLPFIQQAYRGEVVNVPAHEINPAEDTTFTNGLGKIKLIKSQIYPIKDIHNKVKGIVVTLIDVSAENEVKKRDEMLTSVFQVIPDLLFVMKNDGRIVDYRAQRDSQLYMNPEAFIGNFIQDVLPKNVANLYDLNVKRLTEDDTIIIFHYELEIKGELKYFEARIAKLSIHDSIMAIIRDITDLRNKEQILLYQSKLAASGEMIDNIAHQWRQPLSAISTSATGARILKEIDNLSEKELFSILDTINNSAQFLSQTIEDFRSFFKPNKQKNKFYIENSINKLLTLLGPKIKNKNIQVIKNIKNIEIYNFENEFIQVLMNIVSNAIDALEECKEKKKYIFIDVISENGYLVVSIKDNALGVPSEVVGKIFELRFTTKTKGTGIGLYMCSTIINSFKGSLEFRNSKYEFDNNFYKGAEFIIKIPIT